MQYYDWQKRCLQAWLDNGCRGIAHVATGAGKTVLAMAAVERLLQMVPEGRLKIKVVVPRIFLMQQWAAEMRKHLGIEQRDMGMYYGSHKKNSNPMVMIYVVNSARHALARHILHNLKDGYGVLLIADECHHYVSQGNARIFDFAPKIALQQSPFYSLGLSATPRSDINRLTDTVLGPVIFRYGVAEAINDQVISSCIVTNIALHFEPYELDEYQALSDRITQLLIKLKLLFPKLHKLSGEAFFARLEMLARDEDKEIAKLARGILLAAYARRRLAYLAVARLECTVALVASMEAQAKIIIFSELIETSNQIYALLQEKLPGQVGIYHSKRRRSVSRQTLERFRDGAIRVLVSCKALDEGLNIPDADVGIIVSSTNSGRQRTQRLGRVLRNSGGLKRLFYMYIHESNEEGDLLGGDDLPTQTPLWNIEFSEGRFSAGAYNDLCKCVFEYLAIKHSGFSSFNSLQRNLDLGLVRCDWWRSESACRQRIAEAATTAERNYWVAMLYVVLARLRKLKAEQ